MQICNFNKTQILSNRLPFSIECDLLLISTKTSSTFPEGSNTTSLQHNRRYVKADVDTTLVTQQAWLGL